MDLALGMCRTYRWSGCERASWRRRGEGWCSHRTRQQGWKNVSKRLTSAGLWSFSCLIFGWTRSRAYSLLHDGVAQGITHCVALTLELERGGGVGGTGQLERPNVRQTTSHITSSCRGARCPTHHDDALLVQEDGVDGVLGLNVHHGLVILRRILRVDRGRHCV